MISSWISLGLLLSVLAAPSPSASLDQRAKRILASMTTEQKVGQMMMIGFGGKEMGPEIERLLKRYHVGAVALYTRNIKTPIQVARLISDIRKVMTDELQPFIAIDQEGGNVVRVRSQVAVLPGTMTLGATRDPILAFLAGQAHAVDLRLLGFNMNLAPVLDTNINPKNPVINVRAFSDHHDLVARLGQAFVRGQQAGGLATVAKHFPGHGATDNDSHFSLPRISLTLKELNQTELVPFRHAFAAGLDAIMTAHIQIPALDPEGTPASLSQRVITDLLRQKMGYQGLVITDDLEMRAVSEKRGVGPAAVQAILAGADMVMVIWTPRRKDEVFKAILRAVKEGVIPKVRLEESLLRIIKLKLKRGVLEPALPPAEDPFVYLPNAYHQQVARTIATRGTTLVTNKRSLVPLCSGKDVLVASPYSLFRDELKKHLPQVDTYPLKLVSSRKHRERELETLVKLAQGKRLVVFGVANVYQAWLVQQLMRKVDLPVVAVSFGSPYLLRHFPKVAGYLCTYSYLPSALTAAAQALAGRSSITGRLPVSLSKKHQRGQGLTVRRNTCAKTTAAN